MSKKTLIVGAVGSAFVATMAAAPLASAAENPFALTGLSSGYQVADHHGAKAMGDDMKTEAGATSADKMKDGKCGQGKCGANKAKPKAAEGKCGDKKSMPAEPK